MPGTKTPTKLNTSPPDTWVARLDLRFSQRNQRTVLTGRRHTGPLLVQRPFYPEGGACHIYVLHPPGGVVGGDQLNLHCQWDSHAHALITTPAANKCYRSDGAVARVQNHLQAQAGALLEWLPQETIVFDGAKVESATQVRLAPDARFMGWEILCLGRRASAERFTAGSFRQALEIYRDNRPIFLERAHYAGGAVALGAAWGLNHHTTSGTFLITPADKKMLEFARESVQSNGKDTIRAELFSATLIDQLLVCRYLGDSAQQAKDIFTLVWDSARKLLSGRPACPPRIWRT